MLKRVGLTYAELAERLKGQGLLGETDAFIKSKLKRCMIAATFLMEVIVTLELEAVKLANF